AYRARSKRSWARSNLHLEASLGRGASKALDEIKDMKKLTILSIFFATAGLLSACGETMNPSRLVGAGKPAIIASSANPSTSETVTFSLAVSGGVLPGTAVWSDDCNGEFYSQDGTQ